MKESELPPVNAFWSYTMYQLPASVLVKNPIDRYLIDSPMLSDIKRNADSSITLYIQHSSPGKDKESNSASCTKWSFCYGQSPVLAGSRSFNGTWKPKPLVRKVVSGKQLLSF